MSRKKNLIKSINQHLDYNNQGSYKQRQLRRFVLTKIIDDFYCLHCVPPTWYAVTANHVKQLVLHWQNNGLKNPTIMNYLIYLRSFFKMLDHPIENIDNKFLGLTKSHNTSKPQVDRDKVFNELQNPIAKILFGLQSYFGLTISEAIKLIPDVHITENELWITREISTNSKDRIVPIQSKTQCELIALIVQQLRPSASLLKQADESYIRLAYQYELTTMGLSTRIQYRYLYAQGRLHELPHLIPKERVQRIKEEMSISAASTIWSYCHE
jgi:site-specific recombinase XerD